jgi:acetyl-CoA carboxylase carboxyl transferase subunit alpha
VLKFLDFEKPIAELSEKIDGLRHLSSNSEMDIATEITKLQTKLDKMMEQTYKNLIPWQKVQIARHPDRPKFNNYLKELIRDFVPLAGDRLFAEDRAIIGGIGVFGNQTVMVIGQEKGHDTESRMKHNFGMAKPEGYRKANRLMKMAEQFNLPIVSFIDTAGAYPGIDAEERGQAEAIAQCLATCLNVRVPVISIIIGEGGSGGAVAIAAGNEVLILEHSIYSVISPEGCASILWRDGSKAPEAADSQKLTAQDLFALKVIDQIIPEPIGGAHRDHKTAVKNVKIFLEQALKRWGNFDKNKLQTLRRQKYLQMGQHSLF